MTLRPIKRLESKLINTPIISDVNREFSYLRRLQNRESAVRSRMKKREEMEVLEEQVRKLEE